MKLENQYQYRDETIALTNPTNNIHYLLNLE